MNDWNHLRQLAQQNKRRFPKGTKVELVSMEGEADMPQGLRGKVSFVDDIGQIFVKWENGRSLPLNTDVDSFTVLSVPNKKRDEPSR